MSTKIYVAARFPQERFPEALKLIHNAFLEKAHESYVEFVDAVDEERLAKTHKLKIGSKRLQHMKMMVASKEAREMYQRSKMDFLACGFNAWFHEGMVYVIPWGMPGFTDCLLQIAFVTEWMEEYGYWNSTDRPDDISEEEWNERSDTWTAVGPNDNYVRHMESRLTHVVCESKDAYGLFVLEDYHRKKFKLSFGDM